MIKKAIIYKFTSINGKVYIGQTRNQSKRLVEHKTQPFNKNSKEYNIKFYRAIRKYGFESFKFEILEELNNCSQDLIDEREVYWILKFDSFKKGYNSTSGGKSSYKSNGKKCVVYDRSGNKLTFKSLVEFCELYDFKYTTVQHMLSTNSYCEYKNFNNGKTKRFQYVFYKNNGEKIMTNNLNKWCLDNNVKYKNIYQMIKKQSFACSGDYTNGKVK